jgi:hypothetical protein
VSLFLCNCNAAGLDTPCRQHAVESRGLLPAESRGWKWTVASLTVMQEADMQLSGYTDTYVKGH